MHFLDLYFFFKLHIFVYQLIKNAMISIKLLLKKVFLGFFLFFFISVFSQENKLIDSLKTKLNNKLTADEKIKIYDDLIWTYKEKSIDSSLSYSKKALKIVDNTSNKKLKAQLFSDIAGVYMLNGNLILCQKMYWKALAIREKEKDTLGIGKIKANLAVVYTRYNRLDSAMSNSLAAMKIFENKGYKGYAYTLKGNIATIYESIKNYKKALGYNLEVLEYSLQTKNNRLTSKIYGNIANNYLYLKDTINAERSYLKSIEISRKIENYYTLGASLNNLSGLYFDRKQVKKGIKTAEEALKYRKFLNSEIEIADLYYSLGRKYFNIYRFKKSQDYFNKSRKIYENSRDLDKLANTYNFLSILSGKNNNTKEMVFYRKKSDAVFEEYISSKNTKEITELETKYETEKKEKELLQTKADKVTTELKLNNQKQLTYTLIGGLAILVLVGFSIFQRNKRKHELAIANQKEQNLHSIIIAEEKERTKIARDLHDGIVQQIGATIIKSRNIFDKLGITDKKESKELLENFEASNKELRNISHQMMPRALEEAGLITALQHLFDNSLNSSKIKYNFEHQNINQRFPKNIEITLYRITQELLNNILKHSKATEVNIQLFKTENDIIYMIEDNGTGFSSIKKEGIGLKNIKSRIDLIKGIVNFSTENTGTLTSIKIPL